MVHNCLILTQNSIASCSYYTLDSKLKCTGNAFLSKIKMLNEGFCCSCSALKMENELEPLNLMVEEQKKHSPFHG